MKIDIILPVYNEELRICRGLGLLKEYLEQNPQIDYEIMIVDNGSTDKTKTIAEKYCEKEEHFHYMRIEEKGVGIAFRKAVEKTNGEIIGYMDIDMSTELEALRKTYEVFGTRSNIDVVNASRYHKDAKLVGRQWYRNIISYMLVAVLKILFGMKATDAICGFKFFRRDAIESLLAECMDEYGWFLLIEVILRAEKSGVSIYELPVKWVYNEQTKVKVFKVACNYVKHICRLKKKFWMEKNER